MTDAEPADSTGLDPEVGVDISSDVVYSLLADKRRRYTIHYLKQQDEPLSVGDLAEQVASWENGKSVEDITSPERKRVYIALYRSHLPTLEKEGVIEYDDTGRRDDRALRQVAPGSRFG